MTIITQRSTVIPFHRLLKSSRECTPWTMVDLGNPSPAVLISRTHGRLREIRTGAPIMVPLMAHTHHQTVIDWQGMSTSTTGSLTMLPRSSVNHTTPIPTTLAWRMPLHARTMVTSHLYLDERIL